jgi:hypothetical protein
VVEAAEELVQLVQQVPQDQLLLFLVVVLAVGQVE